MLNWKFCTSIYSSALVIPFDRSRVSFIKWRSSRAGFIKLPKSEKLHVRENVCSGLSFICFICNLLRLHNQFITSARSSIQMRTLRPLLCVPAFLLHALHFWCVLGKKKGKNEGHVYLARMFVNEIFRLSFINLMHVGYVHGSC